MTIALQITYRDIEPSPKFIEAIHSRAEWLEGCCTALESRRVIVSRQKRAHFAGGLYDLRVDRMVAGGGRDAVFEKRPAPERRNFADSR